MKLALLLQISVMSFLDRGEAADMYRAPRNLNLRGESVALPVNAEHACSAPGGRVALVLDIHRVRDVPQVCHAVVGLVAIDVVDDPRRPYTVNVQPREPMSAVPRVVDAEPQIPSRVAGSSYVTGRAVPVGSDPVENSGAWVVVDGAPQMRGSEFNVGCGHASGLRLCFVVGRPGGALGDHFLEAHLALGEVANAEHVLRRYAVIGHLGDPAHGNVQMVRESRRATAFRA